MSKTSPIVSLKQIGYHEYQVFINGDVVGTVSKTLEESPSLRSWTFSAYSVEEDEVVHVTNSYNKTRRLALLGGIQALRQREVDIVVGYQDGTPHLTSLSAWTLKDAIDSIKKRKS